MRGLVPWVPRPKLIPKSDGMHGVSGDTHLHVKVPGECRGPGRLLEALWRNGRVYIYRDVGAELLQLVSFFARSEREFINLTRVACEPKRGRTVGDKCQSVSRSCGLSFSPRRPATRVLQTVSSRVAG